MCSIFDTAIVTRIWWQILTQRPQKTCKMTVCMLWFCTFEFLHICHLKSSKVIWAVNLGAIMNAEFESSVKNLPFLMSFCRKWHFHWNNHQIWLKSDKNCGGCPFFDTGFGFSVQKYLRNNMPASSVAMQFQINVNRCTENRAHSPWTESGRLFIFVQWDNEAWFILSWTSLVHNSEFKKPFGPPNVHSICRKWFILLPNRQQIKMWMTTKRIVLSDNWCLLCWNNSL